MDQEQANRDARTEASVAQPGDDIKQAQNLSEPTGHVASEAASENAPDTKPGEATTADDLRDEPYEFERCTVQVTITLLPQEATGDRPAIIGVRSHKDAPLIKMARASDLGELPAPILALLEELKGLLPARAATARARREAEAEQKRIEAERRQKAQPAAAKRSPATKRKTAGASQARTKAPTQAGGAPALQPGGNTATLPEATAAPGKTTDSAAPQQPGFFDEE